MTESEVAVLVERLKNIDEKVESNGARAEVWREKFDAKLDARPCERHNGYFRSIDLQLKAIWAFIALILAELIREHFSR